MTYGPMIEPGGDAGPAFYGIPPERPRARRFIVLGGPRGYLTCQRPDSDDLRPGGKYARWQRLFSVNRPMEARYTLAAKSAALRCFELA